MSQDKMRQKISHMLLESEQLHYELRQALPMLLEVTEGDPLHFIVLRLDDLLTRVEKAESA